MDEGDDGLEGAEWRPGSIGLAHLSTMRRHARIVNVLAGHERGGGDGRRPCRKVIYIPTLCRFLSDIR
jgi:hypothetical protein